MDNILIFVYSYLLLGIYLSFHKTNHKILYLFILLFVSFKVITNYRICTFAYLECKLRNVKRDKSYMNQLLDPIVDLRYNDHIYIIGTLTFLILTYNLIIQEEYKEFYKLFKK